MKILQYMIFGLFTVSFGSFATENCTEVRFSLGTTSVEIRGEAPAEDVLCYLMRTGANQEARIQVLEGSNTMVTVLDVADGRQDISFTTQARQYEIRIAQSLRAIEAQPFIVLISVK